MVESAKGEQYNTGFGDGDDFMYLEDPEAGQLSIAKRWERIGMSAKMLLSMERGMAESHGGRGFDRGDQRNSLRERSAERQVPAHLERRGRESGDDEDSYRVGDKGGGEGGGGGGDGGGGRENADDLLTETDDDTRLSGWVEALGVDADYRPPVKQPVEPAAGCYTPNTSPISPGISMSENLMTEYFDLAPTGITATETGEDHFTTLLSLSDIDSLGEGSVGDTVLEAHCTANTSPFASNQDLHGMLIDISMLGEVENSQPTSVATGENMALLSLLESDVAKSNEGAESDNSNLLIDLTEDEGPVQEE